MTDPATSLEPAEAALHRQQRASSLRFLLGAAAAAIAIAWVATTSFDEQIYFVTVDEYVTRAGELANEEFRVKGNVVPGSYRLRQGTLDEHLFTLTSGGQTLDVFYRGAIPDTFSDEAEVVALGHIRGDAFVAEEVVAKCPSRYDEQVPTATAAN
jgi:cytochrome c-type biogenesis protein CcmE